MDFYIDCEWDNEPGYPETLLSLALVPTEGPEFYEVIDHGHPVRSMWVQKNVVPYLLYKMHSEKQPVRQDVFQLRLLAFLRQFDSIHIIADWPEDIAWFCHSLITGPGTSLNIGEWTAQVKDIQSISEIPHNALYDARANRLADLNVMAYG